MSDVAHGLFCKYCFIFASYNNCLQNLVIKPLQKFSKLTGKDGVLSVHNNNKYHLNAVRAGKDFLKTYSCPKKQVINQISTQRLEQVKENRERLRPIIETLIFCGQQNIAIRGHRDDGKLIDIDNSESSPTSNEGNFRELLRLRIRAGDVSLKKHLENTSSRATYIGKNIQNELLDCIGSVIKSQIVKNVQNAGFYSIMFDETSDISCVEQLSLTLRYVINNEIHEDFVCFVDAYRSIRTNDVLASGETKLTGVALGHIVLDILTNDLGLDLKRCVGVATDGCAVMVSEDYEAVTTIKKKCSIAVYCPCYNHALNNSLAQTSKIVPIRNTIGTLKEIIAFFNASAKRHLVLKNISTKILTGLCQTRWIEMHDGVLQFKSALPKVIEALTDISNWADRISSSKASILLAAICNSDFVISLLSTADILKLTLPVSRLLQTSSLDLANASSAIEGIKEIFQEKRTLCVGEFHKIFLEASSLAEEIGCEIKMPRRAKAQIHRNNYPATDAEQFYLRSIYVPLLDTINLDITNRLSTDTLEAFDLRLLMPNIIVKLNDIDGWDRQRISVRIIAVAKKFSPLFTVSENLMVDMLEGEISLWLHKWKQQPINERPCTALESYMQCDEDMFPTIRTLMQVLATLPVSVASAERSFSTLRRVKTWLRSRMTEDRLSALCLINVYNNLDVINEIDRIIDIFANSKNRRMEFVL
ncbi:zinc finger MYM-type protein 1-like [Acyrthosiphon pisum]|uniref:Repressor of the inhibitor of the protein kinase n=1 Tax=Acyrthosiphon pisum TaxID=7029 RepID=A0A8R2JMJ3_ACYPI|nr:zinc finger MYM-type protein 1-like [Acyrthosiphon pisum]